jgi:hypothetical protein
VDFQIGKKYLLIIPESWFKIQSGCQPWQNQIVFYNRTGTDADLEKADPNYDW